VRIFTEKSQPFLKKPKKEGFFLTQWIGRERWTRLTLLVLPCCKYRHGRALDCTGGFEYLPRLLDAVAAAASFCRRGFDGTKSCPSLLSLCGGVSAALQASMSATHKRLVNAVCFASRAAQWVAVGAR